MAVSQERISVHSLADLKNTSDDAIPTYLLSLKFTQSHTLTDTRLALGYLAFLLCAATFAWDYKYGFDDTKLYTTISVVIYAVLNGFLTFWIFYVEAGTVFVGKAPTGEAIQIKTQTKKFTPIYELSVKVTTAKTEKAPAREVKLMKPFTQWFDKEGRFHSLPFQQMLASGVEVVGKADPSKIVVKEKKGEGKTQGGAAEKSMEDKWASLLAESSEAGTGIENGTPGKAKRRAKKAA